MASALLFLETYNKDDNSLLHCIVTNDGMYINSDKKSKRGYICSPKNPMKCLKTSSARKMENYGNSLFCDRKGAQFVEFMEHGHNKLWNLKKAAKINPKQVTLISKVLFFHNTQLHTVAQMQVLGQFGWDYFQSSIQLWPGNKWLLRAHIKHKNIHYMYVVVYFICVWY